MYVLPSADNGITSKLHISTLSMFVQKHLLSLYSCLAIKINSFLRPPWDSPDGGLVDKTSTNSDPNEIMSCLGPRFV